MIKKLKIKYIIYEKGKTNKKMELMLFFNASIQEICRVRLRSCLISQSNLVFK
jgi:hypothetical protein